jgi:hypothetical protein
MFWRRYVSGAWVAWASKCMLSRPLKLDMFQWVVGFEVQVSKLMFCGMRFLISWNKWWATIETWHVFVFVCSKACIAHVWKPTLGRLKANNTFMTCRWNNVKVECVFIPISIIETHIYIKHSRHSSCVGSWNYWGSEVFWTRFFLKKINFVILKFQCYKISEKVKFVLDK